LETALNIDEKGTPKTLSDSKNGKHFVTSGVLFGAPGHGGRGGELLPEKFN